MRALKVLVYQLTLLSASQIDLVFLRSYRDQTKNKIGRSD